VAVLDDLLEMRRMEYSVDDVDERSHLLHAKTMTTSSF